MKPILYDKTGKIQLGVLEHCINCIVEEERNASFTLTLTYPITDELHKHLIYDNIIIARANDEYDNQQFRIMATERIIKGTVTVKAVHISYDLVYDLVQNVSFEKESCEYALNQLFANSHFSKHYKGYSNIVNAQKYSANNKNIWEAIVGSTGSIIDTYGNGPEIIRDNTNIHVLNKRGTDRGVVIEYSVNMLDEALEIDASSIVTSIYGFARYTDEENNEYIVSTPRINSPLIDNYAHPFIISKDYSDRFEQGVIPTEADVQALVELDFQQGIDQPKCNYTVNFVPLSKCAGYEDIQDQIHLCDIVTIKDARYNIDTKANVINYKYNVLLERYDSMELGDARNTLTQTITSTSKKDLEQKIQDKTLTINNNSYPDSLPATSVLTLHAGLGTIQIDWTYERQIYYSYQLYGSTQQGFTPTSADLLYEGQASSFLHTVAPGSTWYFRVRAKNTHGKFNEFSDEASITCFIIDGDTTYIEKAGILDAHIGTLNLDRGWVGELKGHWIDARNLTVTDGNGKRTLDIDSFGNVNLDVTTLMIKSNTVPTLQDVNSNIESEVSILNNKIEMKVTKGELASSINIEPQSVKINTSKLLLDGDAGNKCQNPSFNAGDADWYGGITIVNGVGSEAKYWGRTLANTYHFYGDEFNVTVGDTMYMGCHCKTYSGTGSFDLGLRIKTTAGEQYFTIDKAYTSDVTWIETKITIPNNAISARLYVYSKDDSTWYFSNVMLRNAVNTELIVDGAIKAKHVEAEEFRGMFNGASGMSKLDYNSLEFVDGNNAKFASFKQDKLNLFNWNKGYIGSLTRSHMAYPETEKEGTVQLSGEYGYFHEFAYNTSLSDENYDISNTNYTTLMRIQYRQSNNASPGVHVMNYPLFVNSELNMVNNSLKLDATDRNRIISEDGLVKLGCQNQLVIGQDTGSGIHQHFSYVTPNTSGFTSYGINIGCWLDMQWNTIWNANYANSYSDVTARSYTETSMIEGMHKQIRVPIQSYIVDGTCRIDIPRAFKNVINNYIVAGLTKYAQGDIWIDEEYEDYFIVKANSDMKFSLDLIINKY